MKKRFLLIFPILLLCNILIAAAADTDTIIKEFISSQKAQAGIAENAPLLSPEVFTAGEAVSDWYAIAMARYGAKDDYPAYLAALETYVETQYAENGGLHRVKATEWHRIALAVMAMDSDPESFGKDSNGNSINLIADGTYNWIGEGELGVQGLNAWIFALICLDARDFEIPDNPRYTIDDILRSILSYQNTDGGFGLGRGTSDIDITAMTLQALAPHYSSEAPYTYETTDGGEKTVTVKQAADAALAYLSAAQLPGGDFYSYGTANLESTAQVVIALCSLGIDPDSNSSFVKEKSAMEGMLAYRLADGSFAHDDTMMSNAMSGEQAMLALTAYLRFTDSRPALYDMRDAEVSQSTANIYFIAAGAVAAAAVAVIAAKTRKKR